MGLVFLLIAGAQLQAQWGPLDNSLPQAGGRCNEVAVVVTDNTGIGIMGADVATENNGFQLTTDSQGIAAIPCSSLQSAFPMVTVTASGYQTTRVALMPDARSRFEIRMDKREDPVARSTGTTVSAAELSQNVRKQSAQLQKEAEAALAAKDYDNAGKLLSQAFQLTPSEASIANNLGIVALNAKDYESAGSWFQKAADEAPFKPEIQGNLGLVRWMQHRSDESYTILIKAFAHGYESILGHYILGTLEVEKGLYKDAADHLKKVPAERYPLRDLYLSMALRNSGKTKAADETYMSFLRRHPAPFAVTEIR